MRHHLVPKFYSLSAEAFGIAVCDLFQAADVQKKIVAVLRIASVSIGLGNAGLLIGVGPLLAETAEKCVVLGEEQSAVVVHVVAVKPVGHGSLG